MRKPGVPLPRPQLATVEEFPQTGEFALYFPESRDLPIVPAFSSRHGPPSDAPAFMSAPGLPSAVGHLEPRDVARLAAELHADQVDRLAAAPVPGRVVPLL